MRCSGCGKEIPFNGQVCPYCQRDKSKDQQYTVLAAILGLGLGYLGLKMFGGWGGIIGFIAGCAIAYVASGAGSSKPPEVHATKERLPGGTETSSEVRLMKLSNLLKKGLIDDSEYTARKKAILDEL